MKILITMLLSLIVLFATSCEPPDQFKPYAVYEVSMGEDMFWHHNPDVNLVYISTVNNIVTIENHRNDHTVYKNATVTVHKIDISKDSVFNIGGHTFEIVSANDMSMRFKWIKD